MRRYIEHKEPPPDAIREVMAKISHLLETHGVVLEHEDGQGCFLARLKGDLAQYVVDP